VQNHIFLNRYTPEQSGSHLIMTVLLFDIDNTLLDFDKAEYDALGKIFAHYHIADTDENRAIYSRENKALWRIHESGGMSREALTSTRFVKAFEALNVWSDGLDGVAIDAEYQTYLSEGHELMSHAKELLSVLTERRQEMYVVSNGTSRVSRPRIVEAGIAEYFQEIFISEEVGAHKPSREFFERVFAQIDSAERKEFTIVGDSLATDILGGRNAGIHTVWYNPKHLMYSEDIKPECEISDLLEILELVGE